MSFFSSKTVVYCQQENSLSSKQRRAQEMSALMLKSNLPNLLDKMIRQKLISLDKKQFINLSETILPKGEIQFFSKQSPISINTRLGGYALYDPAYKMKCPNVFSFDLLDPTQKEIYPSPMNPNDTWGMYPEGITMKVNTGAWTGKEWVVATSVNFDGTDYLGHWFSFEPISGKVKFIGSGNMCAGYYCTDFAYDYTQKKLYGTAFIGTGCQLRLISTTDTTQNIIGILKINENDTLKDPLLALACSNEGTLYGISKGGNLYKINKKTAFVTLVGNLNTSEETQAYVQSATFDKKNNILYYQQSANHENLLCIDTLSGKATTILTGVPEISGLFHHYYDSFVPPMNPNNVSFKTDADNVLKIRLTWTNPSCNFNGDSLTNLAKIYIYRGRESTNLSKFDSVITTQSNLKVSYTNTEKEAGIYYYGIEAVTTENIASPNIQGGELSCVQLSIPYSNDFESMNRIEENYTGDWKKDTSGTQAYQGKGAYVWKYGYTGELQINEIPMQKDEVYIYSIYAKGKPQYGSTVSAKLWMGIKGDSLRMKTPIPLTTTYQKYDIVYKSSALERVQEYFTFETQDYPQNYTFSLDNLTIVLASDYPDSATSLQVKANAQGELNAEISWKNPLVNLKGQTLSGLQKVYLQYADNANFTNYLQEEINIEPNKFAYSGESKDKTYLSSAEMENLDIYQSKNLTFTKQGNWFFRTLTVSTIGQCPYYGSTCKAWIGLDTVLAAPSDFKAEIMAEGNVKFTWDSLSNKGENGGFLNGSNTGYRVIRASLANKKPDTAFLNLKPLYQSEILDLDLYTFEVRGIRNQKYFGKPTSIYSLVGLNPSQYVLKNTEISRKRSYAYPFYVTYSKTASSSAISQFIYTASEMGISKTIDTLLFVKEPASGNAKQIVKQRMLLYMGYKQDSLFADLSDWVSLTEQTLIYDDTVVFDTLRNTVKMAIKPVFYEEGRNVVFTAIKPMQGGIGQGIYPYVYSKLDGISHLCAATDANPKPTETDFINVKTTPAGNGIKADNIPVLVVNQMQNLASLKGKVSRLTNQDPIPEFTLTITSNRSDFYAFNYTHKNSDKNGDFEFTYLPAGVYNLVFKADGFMDSILQISVAASQILVFDIRLEDASKIVLSGKVITPDHKPIEGVKLSLNDLNKSQTFTDAQGLFFMEVYGSTQYTLHFDKEYMQSLIYPCMLTALDTILPNIILNYQALLVPEVEAKINIEGFAEINWEKPNGKTKAQWCQDIEVPTAEHCIGTSAYGSFKAGIYFAPKDLKNMEVANKQLYQVRFYSADSTAKYTLRIYQGEKAATEIYFQRLDTVFFGWNTIQLTRPLSFDTNQNLWVAVEVAAGYKGSPLSLDNGPKTNAKSAWAFLNERWAELSDFMVMNANWNLLAFFRDSIEISAANGYRVYRGLASDSLKNYTLLTPQPIQTLQYIDRNFKNLEFGFYQYALRSDWFNENLSEATCSNPIAKDLKLKIRFVLSTNGASVQGAKLRLRELGLGVLRYQGIADEAGHIDFDQKIDRGNYTLDINLPNHSPIVLENITVIKDSLWVLPSLKEIKSDPYIFTPQVNLQTATLEWSMGPSFTDDMEDYFDFSIHKLGMFQMPFITKKGWIKDVFWKNQDQDQAFVVFNAHETTPIVEKIWLSHSGEKMLVAFYSAKAPNQDWLIRPLAQGGGEFSFYALGVGLKDTKEKFRILYSKTTADTASFIPLTSANYVEASTDWKEYKYEIPTDAKYVAIVYISNDVFALLLDDFTFKHSSGSIPRKIGNPIAYQLYLDGSKVRDANLNTTSHTFENLSEGTHQLGVKAVFASGSSELIEKEVKIEKIKNEKTSAVNLITIYPNPSSTGFYTLSLPDIDQNYELRVMQVGGKSLIQKHVKGGVCDLNLSSLSSGVYFLHIQSTNIFEVIKLILNR